MPEPRAPSSRSQRVLLALETLGAAGLVTADAATVSWLTGHTSDIETGPSPWWLPPVVIIGADRALLLVPEEEGEAAADTGWEVVAYRGYRMHAPEPGEDARRILLPLLGSRIWATEPATLPAALAAGRKWVDAAPALRRMQATKDQDEIERIRAAIRLCDVGQGAARTAHAGMSEIELWQRVRGAMETEAGGRVPLLADLVTGERTASVGGSPGTRTIRDGDAVLVDLVPRRDGYWGDSCSTFCVGEPAPEFVRRHGDVVEALGLARDLLRPGLAAAELDRELRARLGYPHHTGHGIGVRYFERPHVAPGSEDIIEEGMVLALEPGSYGDDIGVRVEQVALVTADGCEILSGHSLELASS